MKHFRKGSGIPDLKQTRASQVRLITLLLAIHFSVAGGTALNQESLLQQADQRFAEGRLEAAIEAYQSYLEEDPSNADVRTTLGVALARLNRFEEALEQYRLALESGTSSDPAALVFNIGLAQYRAGHFDQAEESFKAFLELRPGFPRALILLADSQKRRGKLNEAFEVLDPYREQLSGTQDFVILYSQLLVDLARFESARDWITNSLKKWDSVQLHYLLALCQLELGSGELALEQLEQGLALDPAFPAINGLYGKALRQQGKLSESIDAFRRELQINPSDFDANLYFGIHLYESEGDYAEALQCFERALGTRPGDVLVRFHIGMIKVLTGELEDARVILESVVEEVPTFVEGHASLARLYLRLRDREKAEQHREIMERLRSRQEQQAGVPGAPDNQLAGWQEDWPGTDFARTQIPLESVYPGGPPRDGIPSIDVPRFVRMSEVDWIGDREPVILLEVSQTVRVYPLQILIWHEIVNDSIAGLPVAITFCPLCYSAIAYDRTLGEEVLTFGTTGLLRNSSMIMYDRKSESWWQQITGEAIVGEKMGQKLRPLPAAIVSFRQARERFPESQVLSRETGYDRNYGENPYAGYDDVGSTPFLFKGALPSRLPPMEHVVAVTINEDHGAYPFTLLKGSPVIHDLLGDVPIVILYEEQTATALAQARISEGRPIGSGSVFDRRVGQDTLTFDLSGGKLKDRETGSEWDPFGRAVRGPLKGAQLKRIPSGDYFAFAWLAFRPQVRIYGHD